MGGSGASVGARPVEGTFSPATTRWWRHAAVAALLVVLTVAVYWTGLSGPFLFDDYPNFLRQPLLATTELGWDQLRDAAYSAGVSYPRRGIPRLSFALNHYFAGGFDPFWFKLTNVMIHAANAVLVYALVAVVVRSRSRTKLNDGFRPQVDAVLIAAGVAMVWALHPIQLTATLYVVQRMTSMAATLVLLGLLAYLHGRSRLETSTLRGLLWMTSGLGGGVVLGYLCKQNAVLLPFFALLIEAFFLDRGRLDGTARRWLGRFWIVFGLAPAVIAIGGVVAMWDYLGGAYRLRDFDLGERLLTEARVLWLYVRMILVPDITQMGIFHDDVVVSRGWLTPWTTVVSVVGWALTIGVAGWWGVRRRAVWAFAVLWFVVGHAVESTVLGLELVFEHRNYLPSLGFVLAGVHYLRELLVRLGGLSFMRPVLVALGLGVLAASTHVRATTWSSSLSLLQAGVRNHPESSRYHGSLAVELARQHADSALVYHHWQRAGVLDPRDPLPLFQMRRIVEERLDDVAPGDAADDGPSVFEAPLDSDPRELRRLAAAIDRELERRIDTAPNGLNLAEAAADVQDCSARKVAHCERLLPVLVPLFERGVDNDSIYFESRAMLALSLARILVHGGHLDDGIRYLDRSIALAPDNAQYPFEKAVLMMELKDWDGMERAIAQARGPVERTGFRGPELAILERMLAEGRAGLREGPGGSLSPQSQDATAPATVGSSTR